mmetsp:Transcript_88034/g.284979  ORF Transcript_88034/g.284979 Transcript_88034/m.284979 type:complete len:244 (+) Transcript_88034:52-783(+)
MPVAAAVGISTPLRALTAQDQCPPWPLSVPFFLRWRYSSTLSMESDTSRSSSGLRPVFRSRRYTDWKSSRCSELLQTWYDAELCGAATSAGVAANIPCAPPALDESSALLLFSRRRRCKRSSMALTVPLLVPAATLPSSTSVTGSNSPSTTYRPRKGETVGALACVLEVAGSAGCGPPASPLLLSPPLAPAGRTPSVAAARRPGHGTRHDVTATGTKPASRWGTLLNIAPPVSSGCNNLHRAP